MATAIEPVSEAQLMEGVLLGGDLSKLSASQRVSYYQRVCESVGLNPLTKPFGYITLNGKLVLYALKDAAEQLRSSRKVSITGLDKQFVDDLYIVTAHAITPDGRTDASTGAVTIGNLKGDAKANAIMKAETKAKRRVTLSICGMGFLDESEISSIPDARPVVVTESGDIVEGKSTPAETPDPETISQENGETVPAMQMYRYNDSPIVDAVSKILDFSKQDTARTLYEANKNGQIGKMLTIEEAEQFARNLIAPK